MMIHRFSCLRSISLRISFNSSLLAGAMAKACMASCVAEPEKSRSLKSLRSWLWVSSWLAVVR